MDIAISNYITGDISRCQEGQCYLSDNGIDNQSLYWTSLFPFKAGLQLHGKLSPAFREHIAMSPH